MSELFDAIFFTVFVAAAGLGIASLVMTLFPTRDPNATDEDNTRTRIEYAFFSFASAIIAFTMIIAMWLS
ncbi:MAG: hypothetical protein JJU10_09475 [Idiomarina sp.]|nr:hypothetical protein [Idiomarina sp.]